MPFLPRILSFPSLLCWRVALILVTGGLLPLIAMGGNADTVGSSRPVDWLRFGTETHDVEVTPEAGAIVIQTTGGDPFFWFELPPITNNDRDWIFSLEYFCPDGIDPIQWRVGRPATRDAVALPPMPPGETWASYQVNLTELAPRSLHPNVPQVIRIDLGNAKNRVLRVRDVQLRGQTDAEWQAKRDAEAQRQQKIARSEMMAQYIATNWPATLTSVRIDGTRLVGSVVRAESPRTLFLVPRQLASMVIDPPTDDEWALRQTIELPPNQSDWQVDLAVAPSLLSPQLRWQLFRPSADGRRAPLSACHYVEQSVKQPAARSAPTPTDRHHVAKGLTCLTTQWTAAELRSLGIEHGSINILVNSLMSDHAIRGYTPVQRGDRTWWVNQGYLGTIDREVRIAADAGVQLAGILLLSNRRATRDGLLAIIHPDADPSAVYAMPNLTNRESAELYAETLQMLAERYASPAAGRARIDHWIVHNEVDYGWSWTNMGEQPLNLFMDHYVRSMRMVDVAVRTVDPTGRVFISLTHRWNVPDDQPWKTYAPRDLLAWLIRSGQVEGDFPWGVAYHPYPQSLFRAATWLDDRVSGDLDTELITPKNLPVLDAFMHQPEVRMASGEVRPVICSEQGFHADSTKPEQLEVQSAALLYTFAQLRRCPSILAFDYHRPTDHQGEGGLLLGLRGYATAEDPLGPPKPAYEVFRAINTSEEAECVERLRHVWED